MVSDFTAAWRRLEAGDTAPVYLVFGSEAFLRDRFVSRLKQRIFGASGASGLGELNLLEWDGAENPLEPALAAAGTAPFMAERRLVLIKNPPVLGGRGGRDDESEEQSESGASSQDEEALLRYLARPVPTTCLVLVAGAGVDKRRRLFKLLDQAGEVAECAPLKEADLPNWLRQRARELGGEIQADAAALLAQRLPEDLYAADSELRKVLLHAGQGNAATRADVAAVVAGADEGDIFALLDAIGRRDAKHALERLAALLRTGEPPIRILFMIARQLRLILGAAALGQRGYAPKEIEKSLGVSPYAARIAVGQRRHFTGPELVASLERVLAADLAIKTGSAEPGAALELLVVELCRLA